MYTIYKKTILILFIILLDQILKNFIINNMNIYQEKEIFSFFSIYLTINKGIAFSFFDYLNPLILLIINIFVTILLILLFMFKKKEIIENYGYIFIIGGAIGNIIDRIRFQYVIDYFFFHINSFSFAVFNLSDVFIMIGTIILIKVEIIKENKKL